MDWYSLTIIGMLLFGLQHFLFKMSAEKKCNTAWTSFSFMLTVAIISTVLFIFTEEAVTSYRFLLLISLLNAVTYLVTTMTRIEALKHLPTSVAYPIVRMSTVLVVLFSVVYFKDELNLYQVLGIILALLVIVLLTRENNKRNKSVKNTKLGVILVLVSLVFSAITTIVSKFAAIGTSTLAYISISYIYNTLFTFSLRKRLQGKKDNPKQANAIMIGIFIGITNFIAFYLILKAMAIGPLSLITAINGFYFIIAIILSIIIYKEKLTRTRIVAIILSVAAVMLMKT